MNFNRLCPYCMHELATNEQFCSYCGNDPKTIKTNSTHLLPLFSVLQGKYLIGRVLAEGGFGITYIGIDMYLELRVAIKEFYPNGYVTRDNTHSSTVTQLNNSNLDALNKWKDGFVKEARALAKFQNLPGIRNVKDFFEENQTAYIVMEYLEGKTLKQYLKECGGKIPPDQLIDLILPIMNSLQKVHEAGVIHRDISPDNIMFLSDGSMRLLDFGAARMSVMLKPGYSPVEQYRTRGHQGPWSDIYALSGTIYKCITGIRPDEALERMCSDSLKSPRSLGIDISPETDAAIMKALSIHAENRYQSMAEFSNALTRQLKQNVSTNNSYEQTNQKSILKYSSTFSS